MQKSYLSLWKCTLSNCHVVSSFLECWRVVIDICYYNCYRCVTFQIWTSIVSCLEESKEKREEKRSSGCHFLFIFHTTLRQFISSESNLYCILTTMTNVKELLVSLSSFPVVSMSPVVSFTVKGRPKEKYEQNNMGLLPENEATSTFMKKGLS